MSPPGKAIQDAIDPLTHLAIGGPGPAAHAQGREFCRASLTPQTTFSDTKPPTGPQRTRRSKGR